MTTIEAPIPAVLFEDTDEVEEFIAHLYRRTPWMEPRAICGISSSNDPHVQMHAAVDWPGVGSNCPICQAKVCPDCERLA